MNERNEHGHYLLSVSQQFHPEMVGSVVSKQVGLGFDSSYATCGFCIFSWNLWDSSLQAKHKLIGFFKSPPGVCMCVFFFFVHTENQATRCTSKVRTFWEVRTFWLVKGLFEG